MSDESKTFNIGDSNVQIAPNAKYTVQNFFGVKYAKQVLGNRPCKEEDIPIGTILDMFYYSDTKPCPVSNEIIRKEILALCEKRLVEDNVLCLYGEEGVGVSTVLAQFAREHVVTV